MDACYLDLNHMYILCFWKVQQGPLVHSFVVTCDEKRQCMCWNMTTNVKGYPTSVYITLYNWLCFQSCLISSLAIKQELTLFSCCYYKLEAQRSYTGCIVWHITCYWCIVNKEYKCADFNCKGHRYLLYKCIIVSFEIAFIRLHKLSENTVVLFMSGWCRFKMVAYT